MAKNKDVEISVVVPCYNSEKYIERALLPLCNQTYKNYEIICVDDGSSDNTVKILKQYSKKYDFFRFVVKENDRSKTTILVGLKETLGKYICVVDNDDIITNDYLEVLYNRIIEEDADISVCGFQRQSANTGKIISTEMNKRNDCLNVYDNCGELLEINTSLWNKMIKRDLIIPYLKEKELFSMDMLFMIFIYAKAKRIAFTDKILYFYQVSESSSINNMKIDYLNDIQKALLVIKKYYLNTNKEMYSFLCTYVFLHIAVSLNFRFYSSNCFKEAYKSNKIYLKEHFNEWRRSKYLRLTYVLKNHGKNMKLYICKVFYKIHLFKLFLFLYNFVVKKLKFEIKW